MRSAVRFDNLRDSENILDLMTEELRLVIIAFAAGIALRGLAHRFDVHPDGEQQNGFARFIRDGGAGRPQRG